MYSSGIILTHPPPLTTLCDFYYELYKPEAPDLRQCVYGPLGPSISRNNTSQAIGCPNHFGGTEFSCYLYEKTSHPGLDRIPPELVLKIWNLVGPLLFNSIQYSLDTGYFHRDQKAALIKTHWTVGIYHC